MFRKGISRLLVVLILLVGLSSMIQAQDNVLNYEQVISGTLNPGSPMIYTFTGSAGDVVTLYVATDFAIQASLSVSNSSGQPLGFSTEDTLTPMTNDVRVTATLPGDDTYIVTLNNQSDVAGNFSMSLSVADTLEQTVLTGSLVVTIAPDGTAQQFIIPANPDIPQIVSIQTQTPDVFFTALLQSAEGTVLASIPVGLNGITLVIPAGDLDHILTIDAADSTAGATVEIEILAGGAPAPATTEESQATDPNVCTVTASGVNVRSGPDTGFGVIGSLNEGTQFIATGQNSGWYNGTFNGQSAWVAASVVQASGNCGNLPTVDAPALPATAAPTQAPVDNTQPTATTQPTEDQNNNNNNQQPTTAPPTTAPPTEVPTQAVAFTVTSMSCRYLLNDGAYVDYRVEGPPNGQFRIDVRQGSTTYSVDRTMNSQGFLSGSQRFGQAGNSNYTAYIVYNGADVASAPC